MAIYKFSHLSEDKDTAFFSEVRYVSGEAKISSHVLFKMDPSLAGQTFDPSYYYEIFKNDDGETLTPIGLRIISPGQLIEIENVRIAKDLEKGKNPLPLNEEQEEHNKRAFDALEKFMQRKSKKAP